LTEIAAIKRQLRADLMARRDAIPGRKRDEYNDQIVSQLKRAIQDIRPLKIFAYFAVRSEPSVMDQLLAMAEIPELYAPAIGPSFSMDFRRVIAGQVNPLNQFRIPEPPSHNQRSVCDDSTLVLVPCLAMSREGQRLGYGGGYYDRFLAANPQGLKIGIVYDELLCSLPIERHDIALHGYCTQTTLAIF
jgi:5-formyltetrahydrofolate cyclo-ligase